VFADHTDLWLIGIDVLKSVREPVRHGIAEYNDLALGCGVAFLGRRRL
jgi:hypothetical protein